MIEKIIIIGLLVAFVVLLEGKLGVRGKITERSRVKLISQMFACDFCLCFWTSVFICMVITIVTGDLRVMVLPFFTTPLARFLL